MEHSCRVLMMLLTRSKREFSLAVAMFVSLLTLEITSGAPVEASCGAYLHTTAIGRIDHHISRTATANAADGNYKADVLQSLVTPETQPEPVHLPCSGPGCRRGASPPPVPAIPVNSRSHRCDVCHADVIGTGTEVLSAQRSAAISSARALRGFPLMVDVPPEAGC